MRLLELVPGQVGRSSNVSRRGRRTPPVIKGRDAGPAQENMVFDAGADSSDEEPDIPDIPDIVLDQTDSEEGEQGQERPAEVLDHPGPHVPSLERRSITCKQATQLLRSVALGSFGRFLHLNIDSENRVGPLAGPAVGNKHLLPQFHKHFGGKIGDVPERDYCSKFGEVTQRNISPNCIRTYDVGTFHYVDCMGGGQMRSKRRGIHWVMRNRELFSEMVIGSVLLRVLGKVHAFKTWNVFTSPDGKVPRWSLPGVEDIPSFIQFVKGSSQTSRKGRQSANELGVWTSQQFVNTLDPMFKTRSGFEKVMLVWKDRLPALIDALLQDKGDLHGRRDRFIKSVVDLFLQAECTPRGKSLTFVSTQIVLDLEEVVGENVFGPVGKCTLGKGAKQGMAVMIEKEETALMEAVYESEEEELNMMGLNKDKGVICVSLNGRELNLGDIEHCLCKIGIFAHRLPGGTRSFSTRPRQQVPHCYPICWKGVKVESKCEKHFREVASMAIQAFKQAVDNDTWVPPTGILGEKCWSSS